MRTITVGKNDSGQRLDKFIMKATVGMPQSLLYKYIRKKCIKVNGKREDASHILSDGDVITLYVSDEFFRGGGKLAVTSVEPKLNIVYEDDNIIICDKPSGVLVHSGDASGEASDDKNTLIGHIQAYLYRKGEYDPNLENTFAPALCNRIDRNTRGLVIAAKNARALRDMNEIIKSRKIDKYYLAAVHGSPEPREAALSGWLLRGGGGVRVFDREIPGSKPIRTKYRTLAVSGSGNAALALLEIELLTGRTHQIRAHMEAAGHPLLGEGRYGGYGEAGKNNADRKRGYKSQALCAYKLTFRLDGYDGVLSYLKGKTVKIDTSTVDFLREFEVGKKE